MACVVSNTFSEPMGRKEINRDSRQGAVEDTCIYEDVTEDWRTCIIRIFIICILHQIKLA
jgi:hypothetical protein